ncbi:hypothetical protein GCM10023091_43220 [Ravibacter arvi]|uniref:Uncharacterized protein n=1 Tax=Ravibacter arvi TaxID=2051041 RepID=A0ABP8MB78_9BACT
MYVGKLDNPESTVCRKFQFLSMQETTAKKRQKRQGKCKKAHEQNNNVKQVARGTE